MLFSGDKNALFNACLPLARTRFPGKLAPHNTEKKRRAFSLNFISQTSPTLLSSGPRSETFRAAPFQFARPRFCRLIS